MLFNRFIVVCLSLCVMNVVYADSPIYSPVTHLILLNDVSTKDLLKIRGVNPSMARAIQMYRDKHGRFKSVEELANVKGFKKLPAETLRAIEAQVTVAS